LTFHDSAELRNKQRMMLPDSVARDSSPTERGRAQEGRD
jgi:hypothetical protein